MKGQGRCLQSGILWFLFSVLLVGCASTASGPMFQPASAVPDSQGLIYLYRPSLPYEWGASFDVEANGVLAATMLDGGYYPYYAKPGRVVLSSTRGGETISPVVITVKPQEVYYVKLIPVRGVFRMKPELTLMDRKAAEAEISKTRLIQ
jgi:hypothetical protein